jgi:hypothetical protein
VLRLARKLGAQLRVLFRHPPNLYPHSTLSKCRVE